MELRSGNPPPALRVRTGLPRVAASEPRRLSDDSLAGDVPAFARHPQEGGGTAPSSYAANPSSISGSVSPVTTAIRAMYSARVLQEGS